MFCAAAAAQMSQLTDVDKKYLNLAFSQKAALASGPVLSNFR